MSKHLRAAAALASLALLATGCSSSDLQSAADKSPAAGTSTAASAASAAPSSSAIVADPALKAMLPASIQSSGVINVGVDATYPPNESLDADGKTVVGMDVELFDAVAAQMGVKTAWHPTAFDSILNGINAGKYDAGVSSFTINAEREKSVNMVNYLNAGSQWVTLKGNPKNVDPTDPTKLCGLTIAVQKGTTQNDQLSADNAKCAPDKKIDLLVFDDQGLVTNSVLSGRAAAMTSDSPIALNAVKNNSDKMVPLGNVYDAAPYGFVVSKQNTQMAEAIAKATKELKASGRYDAILAKYGQQASAQSDFQVNPPAAQ